MDSGHKEVVTKKTPKKTHFNQITFFQSVPLAELHLDAKLVNWTYSELMDHSILKFANVIGIDSIVPMDWCFQMEELYDFSARFKY